MSGIVEVQPKREDLNPGCPTIQAQLNSIMSAEEIPARAQLIRTDAYMAGLPVSGYAIPPALILTSTVLVGW